MKPLRPSGVTARGKMVTDPRFAHVAEVDENQTTGEEIALVLAGVIMVLLCMVTGAVVMLRFFDLLPASAAFVAFLSIAVFALMLARAVLSRALSTPAVYGRRLSARRVIGPPGI